jgi:hypothetical protein
LKYAGEGESVFFFLRKTVLQSEKALATWRAQWHTAQNTAKQAVNNLNRVKKNKGSRVKRVQIPSARPQTHTYADYLTPDLHHRLPQTAST